MGDRNRLPLPWINGPRRRLHEPRPAARTENAGEARAAIPDYDQAITLRQELRQRMGADFPLPWVNYLANAYMNRGNARAQAGEAAAAIPDYDRAIALQAGAAPAHGRRLPPCPGSTTSPPPS